MRRSSAPIARSTVRQMRSATSRRKFAVRDALVCTRTRYVAMIKAFVREGLRLSSGEGEGRRRSSRSWCCRSTRHNNSRRSSRCSPRSILESTAADARLLGFSKENVVAGRLRSMLGIGPVTAIAFVAALDDVARFQNAHQVPPQAQERSFTSNRASFPLRAAQRMRESALRASPVAWPCESRQ